MKIGYHASHEQFTPAELLAFTRAAEKAGFSAAMCSDHFHPWSRQHGQSAFAWSWLGAAMQATELPFGVVCAPGQRYHPAVIAQAVGTLLQMYPGRFWMAVGSGQLLNEGITGGEWPMKKKPSIKTFIRHVAESACRLWQKPDSGIWEVRGEPQHFTYSKVMAWVALDRAIRLVNQYGFEGNVEQWSAACDEIKQQVFEHGFSQRLGAFVTAFDTEELDASLLRIPLMEFLPVEDPRVEGTVNLIMERLITNDLVYRYRFDDGLPGEEGAFGLCTFWLIDVLSLAGRVDEATRIFRNMVDHANRLGLFSEEIEPHTSLFLGNFPQAFTHIGLINSALYLAWARGECLPEYAPTGTKERSCHNRWRWDVQKSG